MACMYAVCVGFSPLFLIMCYDVSHTFRWTQKKRGGEARRGENQLKVLFNFF